MIKGKFKVTDKGVQFEDLNIEGSLREIEENLAQFAVMLSTEFIDNIVNSTFKDIDFIERLLIASSIKKVILENFYSMTKNSASDVLKNIKVVVGEDNLVKDFEEFSKKYGDNENLNEFFKSLL